MGEYKKRRAYVGRVISDKMDKTVVLAVTRKIAHPRYNKTISRTTKFKVHDEKNECKVGDLRSSSRRGRSPRRSGGGCSKSLRGPISPNSHYRTTTEKDEP